MDTPWAVTAEKIQQAVDRIVAVRHPSRVIVFGSVVRGTVDRDSDVDLLVVTKEDPDNRRAESVRLRRALRGISMPMDVLVISERQLQEVAERPGLVYREALRNGKVVYAEQQP